ncbi:hypothetical protein SETIT_9G542500v2 [Setaria italica]|uniref:Uncharacterized protein n=1 Tax=Setaria italica TaxID=4555 RepID=A0A368SY95_SETIT|nr:hypothetical protein SETIT_9G542500v2 [Setaria italica]
MAQSVARKQRREDAGFPPPFSMSSWWDGRTGRRLMEGRRARANTTSPPPPTHRQLEITARRPNHATSTTPAERRLHPEQAAELGSDWRPGAEKPDRRIAREEGLREGGKGSGTEGEKGGFGLALRGAGPPGRRLMTSAQGFR